MIELAPSLLAADVLHLQDELDSMVSCGVKTLHFDVMDAHFVPNLSFGPAICGAIHKKFPGIKMDVHLMMDNPLEYLDAFITAGADEITLHQEVLIDAEAALREIKARGCKAGLSVKPGTPVDMLYPYMDLMDLVLIMTVEPGFGGQKFQPQQVSKISLLREKGFQGCISVDGGVNAENAVMLAQAGATRLVMGTAFFKADDRKTLAGKMENL